MAVATDTAQELKEHFAPHDGLLPQDVLGELESILRLHSLTPQELFFKWESYSIKMGAEDTRMDWKTARDFKKDIQDALEREARGKAQSRAHDKKSVGATPRNARAGGNMFGMMEGISPNTPDVVPPTSTKRKNDFQTPAAKAAKANGKSSPSGPSNTPNDPQSIGKAVAFSERQNPGEIIESLNNHIAIPEPPSVPHPASRIKLKANSDMGKFAYKTMAMKLSAASEILDDRIDEFVTLVQEHHELEDSAFGNAASQSPTEIVAVGRIACDTSEGKLNANSIVLETSRRTGAGLRVPLKLDAVSGYDFFPGKIVALRGSNPSGEQFTVSEILELPIQAPPASSVAVLEANNAKVEGDGDGAESRPLNVLVGAGPYTADTNLDFEPFNALCEKASTSCADVLILVGPFIDIEQPMIASGDIPELPSTLKVSPDQATLTDVFHAFITLPLQRLVQAVPSISVILVPSVRDAVNKHSAWPQDRMIRKELGLPKQVSFVTNPITISLNEFVLAISSHDVLYELRREECTGGNLPAEDQNLLARLSKQLIEQRHFFPIFPPSSRDNLPKPTVPDGVDAADVKATGAMLDTSYLTLGEWPDVKPDMLISPSILSPFTKVVKSVVVVNPGTVSKKRGAGTYTQMTIGPRKISDAEKTAEDLLEHRMYDRARVDVVRI